MNTWKIKGPAKISGKVEIKGNKNSALPCIAASLLLHGPEEKIILKNVPKIKDVATLCEIIGHLGIKAAWIGKNILVLRPQVKLNKIEFAPEIVTKIRGSVLLLGPLLGRNSSFFLPKPGGDKIGTRPLTAHTVAFQDLGFEVSEDSKNILVKTPLFLKTDQKKIKIWLTERSVTATANLLLFSSSLKKSQELSIYGAACEPHIVTLCGLLSGLGATISGAGSNIINIKWKKGLKKLKSRIHVDSDFMEAATYAVAGAVTKSDLSIKLSDTESLSLIDRYLGWMGIKTVLDHKQRLWKILSSQSSYEISPQLKVIKAEPWPGFPTDIMSLFAVLATQCKGTVKFLEYMYDDRFSFVQLLKDMGADIEENYPHVIKVHGPTKLSGLETFIRPDIRSGAAMLIAALAAEGITVLHDKNDVISRGYEKLPETLKSLGADIKNC